MADYEFVAIRSGEGTLAIIHCMSPYGTPKTEVLKNIREGVRNWLSLTEEGQTAWKESCQDFNWGDLSNYTYETKLIDHLRAKRIFGLEVRTLVSNGIDEILTFDEIFDPDEAEIGSRHG